MREPKSSELTYYRMAAVAQGRPRPAQVEGISVRTPIFGLSTTPVTDIKSELRLQLERDLLALLYRTPR
jgi:hypothetical protein